MTFLASKNRNLLGALASVLVISGGVMLWQNSAFSFPGGEEAVVLAPPAVDEAPSEKHSEVAVFAGGCFWGVQGVFQHVKGVTNAVSGYAGGAANTADYERVSGGDTSHAEAVQITYDPTQVSYGTLLQIFFSVAHNPTQLNRQGPDHGTQYRSAIFPANTEQRKVAQAYIEQLDGASSFNKPIVTTIEEHASFYPAEDYHQDFLTENPNYPYIVVNDLPKVANLKQVFSERYSDKAVLVKAAR